MGKNMGGRWTYGTHWSKHGFVMTPPEYTTAIIVVPNDFSQNKFGSCISSEGFISDVFSDSIF